MKLHEVAQIKLYGFIAVPRGSIWQKDIKGIWVFDRPEDADAASHTVAAQQMLDVSAAGYFLPIETLNDIALLMLVTNAGMHAIRETPVFHVYAYGISEAGTRLAAEKAAAKLGQNATPWVKPNSLLWCYKTYNNDPSIFQEEDE